MMHDASLASREDYRIASPLALILHRFEAIAERKPGSRLFGIRLREHDLADAVPCLHADLDVARFRLDTRLCAPIRGQ